MGGENVPFQEKKILADNVISLTLRDLSEWDFSYQMFIQAFFILNYL